jgi:hypothetical protein
MAVRGVAGGEVGGGTHGSMPSSHLTIDHRTGPREGDAFRAHPPPSAAPDCPLYLRHLALLI